MMSRMSLIIYVYNEVIFSKWNSFAPGTRPVGIRKWIYADRGRRSEDGRVNFFRRAVLFSENDRIPPGSRIGILTFKLVPGLFRETSNTGGDKPSQRCRHGYEKSFKKTDYGHYRFGHITDAHTSLITTSAPHPQPPGLFDPCAYWKRRKTLIPSGPGTVVFWQFAREISLKYERLSVIGPRNLKTVPIGVRGVHNINLIYLHFEKFWWVPTQEKCMHSRKQM